MAIEYGSSPGNNQFVEAAMNPAVWALLADIQDTFQFCVNLNPAATGSTATKIGQVKWDDAMASAAEAASVSATDPTISRVTCTIGRYALRRDVTDLYSLAGPPSGATIADFAARMADAASRARTSAVTGLFGSVSNSVGTSGSAMVANDFYNAMFQLTESRVPGPWVCLLSPAQLVDLQGALRSEGGPTQYVPASQEMLRGAGPGLAGTFEGVQIWSSDQVQNSGDDAVGCMWGMGAFGYQESPVASIASIPSVMAQRVPAASPILVEFERSAASATTSVIGSYYFGTVMIEDARAVAITTSKD